MHELQQYKKFTEIMYDTVLENQLFFAKALDNESDSTGNKAETEAA